MPSPLIWVSVLAILALAFWIDIYGPELHYSALITRTISSVATKEELQIKLKLTTHRNMAFPLSNIHEKLFRGFSRVQRGANYWIGVLRESFGNTSHMLPLQTLKTDLADLVLIIDRMIDQVLFDLHIIVSRVLDAVSTNVSWLYDVQPGFTKAFTSRMIDLAPFLADSVIGLTSLVIIWAAGKIWAPLGLVMVIFEVMLAYRHFHGSITSTHHARTTDLGF